MSVAKLIPDNPSRDKVKLAFDILAESEAFTRLPESLPPLLCNISTGEVDNITWNRTQTWTSKGPTKIKLGIQFYQYR